MTTMLVFPILIPLTAAGITLLFRRRVALQKLIGILSSSLYLVIALLLALHVRQNGLLVHHVGSWPAPYGIALIGDAFAVIMLVLTGVMAFTVSIFSLRDIPDEQYKYGYTPLIQLLTMGVSGAFLTGDLFNLYVWFEVLLISSFVLLILGGKREQIQGALKYVTINLLASVFFLTGVALLYGKVGTLNMADLAMKLGESPNSQLINSSVMLLLVAFSIKSAAFPFFFWLPDSYHTPSFSVSALFSGLLTKVGVYAMIRMFIMVYRDALTLNIILVLAGFTMVIGVLGAVAQLEMRRLLSFHIISQIGYSMMGLGIATRAALVAAIFFTFHVAVAKAALFLVAGVIGHERGTTRLKKLGGLYQNKPWLAVLFLLPALALAGLPPLSGFAAKFALIKAGLEAGQIAIVVTALAVSILTLYSMTKIWTLAFWAPMPAGITASESLDVAGTKTGLFDGMPAAFWLPLLLMAVLVLAMGLFAEPLLALSRQAADTLMNPDEYIHAVLGRTI